MAVEKTKDIMDQTMRKLEKAMKHLQNTEVVIGVPENETAREASINNASLARIHDKGSPLQGIEARPIFTPAIIAHREEIHRSLKQASDAAAKGNVDQIKPHLEEAGLMGMNALKNQFHENNWKPNKPATIRKKKSDQTLVDTGQLRNSMNYVVRQKNGRD